MERADVRRLLTRLEGTLLVLRTLAAVPLGLFGLFVLFSVFGEGSVVMGALMILAALAAPAIHTTLSVGLRRGRPWAPQATVWASLGLILLDGAALSTFAYAGLRQGEVLVPLGILAVLGVHSLCAWLGHEIGQPARGPRPGVLAAVVGPER